MDPPVREARETDRPALRRILALCPESGEWTEADWTPPRRCLVAERDGAAAGFLLASCPADDEAEILMVAVDPGRRRAGVGKALMAAFLAGRRGRVFLEVRPSNTAARRLYERFGFVETGRRRSYYLAPPEDALVLQVFCGL